MVFTGKEEDDNFTEVALDGSRESNDYFIKFMVGFQFSVGLYRVHLPI